MNNFYIRSITAFFFGLTCIASIYFGNIIHVLFFVFSALALVEFHKIYSNSNSKYYLYLSISTALIIYSLISLTLLELIEEKVLWIIPFIISVVFISALYQKNTNPFEKISQYLLSVVYIVLPFSMFCSTGYIATNNYAFEIPLGILFILWANDTGAYIFGIRFGKNRLFERISPKKSWEGFLGGLFTAMLFAYLISNNTNSLDSLHWINLSIIVVVFGTFGDLVESMFKRSRDIKDSGSILPGHGGILDRFDGLLLAAPMVYVYLKLFL